MKSKSKIGEEVGIGEDIVSGVFRSWALIGLRSLDPTNRIPQPLRPSPLGWRERSFHWEAAMLSRRIARESRLADEFFFFLPSFLHTEEKGIWKHHDSPPCISSVSEGTAPAA